MCRWSEEKSTAGVTLISGVIFIVLSPRTCARGGVFSVTTAARQCCKCRCIHAGLEHTGRKTEKVSVESETQ